MSNINKVSVLVNGEQETVDLSTNTLVVQNISVNGVPINQAQAVAFFTGTIPGTATPVTITANNPGSVGNSIALVFNGSTDITTEIAAWNIAHPSNQATLSAGNGSQTPSAQTVNLTGGLDPGSSIIGDTTIYVNFTPTSPTIAGSLAGIDAALASVSGSQHVDKFTLNGTDITNKFVTLSATPIVSGNTILIIEDAPGMFFGIDFTVSGNQLGWNGLALDGILSAGDNLTITYKS